VAAILERRRLLPVSAILERQRGERAWASTRQPADMGGCAATWRGRARLAVGVIFLILLNLFAVRPGNMAKVVQRTATKCLTAKATNARQRMPGRQNSLPCILAKTHGKDPLPSNLCRAKWPFPCKLGLCRAKWPHGKAFAVVYPRFRVV
jgi:hypothetical protein